MKKPRLLITGGSSYLGQALIPLSTTAYDVCYTFFKSSPYLQATATAVQLDLRQKGAVVALVESWQPQAIIHLAGSNRSPDMETVITAGANHIAQAAAAMQARLIHLSSDVIFDGLHAPYDETASPTPRHAYGRAKAEAEQSITSSPDHVIIRTSLIYGFHAPDRSTEWIATALHKGEPVTLFNNQWRNPIAADTLGRACLELITHPYQGVLNIAGNEIISRADYALKLLDWWQINKRDTLHIAPAPVDAPWPPDTTLNINKALQLLKTPLPGVTKTLEMWSKT